MTDEKAALLATLGAIVVQRQSEIANMTALGRWADDMYQQVADTLTAALTPIGVLLCPDTMTPGDRARMDAYAHRRIGPRHLADMFMATPEITPQHIAEIKRGIMALGDEQKEPQA